MGDWISVKDKLPPAHLNVLFVGKRGGMFIGYIYNERTRIHEDGSVYVAVPNARRDRNGVYWMPLPEPPKEG